MNCQCRFRKGYYKHSQNTVIAFKLTYVICCNLKDTRWLHASDVVPVDVDKQHSNDSHDDPSC